MVWSYVHYRVPPSPHPPPPDIAPFRVTRVAAKPHVPTVHLPTLSFATATEASRGSLWYQGRWGLGHHCFTYGWGLCKPRGRSMAIRVRWHKLCGVLLLLLGCASGKMAVGGGHVTWSAMCGWSKRHHSVSSPTCYNLMDLFLSGFLIQNLVKIWVLVVGLNPGEIYV
jgi:hypothetical protein